MVLISISVLLSRAYIFCRVWKGLYGDLHGVYTGFSGTVVQQLKQKFSGRSQSRIRRLSHTSHEVPLWNMAS